MSQPISVILCEPRDPDAQREALTAELLAALGDRPGVALTIIPHPTDVASDGPTAEFLRSLSGDVIVLAWMFERTVYWLLRARGLKGRLRHIEHKSDSEQDHAERALHCLDLRQFDQAAPLLERIDRIAATATGGTSSLSPTPRRVEETTAPRWYPVIDFDRCNNCLECLNFCLFGVYGLDENNSILLELPDACRAGCPACARICPAGAIIFPEHADQALAGDPNASLEGLKLDLSQLFGGAAPGELAAAERDRALVEKRTADRIAPPERDALDDLVDELDEMDL